MARPSTYSRRRANRLLLALSAGANMKESALFGRIPRSTLYYWLGHSRRFQNALDKVNATLHKNLESGAYPPTAFFRKHKMWLAEKYIMAQQKYDLKHHPDRWQARMDRLYKPMNLSDIGLVELNIKPIEFLDTKTAISSDGFSQPTNP